MTENAAGGLFEHPVKRLLATAVCVAMGSMVWAGVVVLSRGPVATVKSGPAGLLWEPHVPYERLVLTVKQPGGAVIRKEFDSGTKPSFGGKLADGQYTYELSVIPVVAPKVRQALEQARATGNMSIVADLRAKGALPHGPQVQSGYFRVYQGEVIPPQGVEPPYKGKKKK